METLSNELHYKTVSEVVHLLNKKEISSVELTKAVIARTESTENDLKSFISYDKDDALIYAELSDKRRKDGKTMGHWTVFLFH